LINTGYGLARHRKETNLHLDFLSTLKILETDADYSIICNGISLSKNKIDHQYYLKVIDGYININGEEMRGLRGTEKTILERLRGSSDQFLFRTAQQLFSDFRKNFDE